MLTESEIVVRVLAGETELFGEVVRRHQQAVLARARWFVRDVEEARDVAQDVFLRAYQRLQQLQHPERIGGWLRQITYTICMNRLKQGEFGPAGPSTTPGDSCEAKDSGPGPDEQAHSRELADTVLRAIGRLPQDYADPLRMHYLEGASQAEVADRLGLTAGSLRTRLHRGRKLLAPALAAYSPIDVHSRNKERRLWPPSRFHEQETTAMSLQYRSTPRRLLRGDAEVSIRPMQQTEIAALRTFDQESTEALADFNEQRLPGNESVPGGPWAQDDWLRAHFAKYQERGFLTLLAEEGDRVVGFADLWVADEPEPFGRSLNVECIDYFREHYLAGLETILLEEAEAVARRAGLPALDIGTNTSSGDYPALRGFGLRVFYEYDEILCACRRAGNSARASIRPIEPREEYLAGLIKVSHWSPTDFTFRDDEDPWSVSELTGPWGRAVLELWRYEPSLEHDPPVPPNAPNRSELYLEPDTLGSAEAMGAILAECAGIAAEHGAERIELPAPSGLEITPPLEILDRRFAYAWMRKELTEPADSGSTD